MRGQIRHVATVATLLAIGIVAIRYLITPTWCIATVGSEKLACQVMSVLQVGYSDLISIRPALDLLSSSLFFAAALIYFCRGEILQGIWVILVSLSALIYFSLSCSVFHGTDEEVSKRFMDGCKAALSGVPPGASETTGDGETEIPLR